MHSSRRVHGRGVLIQKLFSARGVRVKQFLIFVLGRVRKPPIGSWPSSYRPKFGQNFQKMGLMKYGEDIRQNYLECIRLSVILPKHKFNTQKKNNHSQNINFSIINHRSLVRKCRGVSPVRINILRVFPQSVDQAELKKTV